MTQKLLVTGFLVLLTALAISPDLRSRGERAGSISSASLSQPAADRKTTFDCLHSNTNVALCSDTPDRIVGPPTPDNWSQLSSTAITGGLPSSITLTPCPAGVDYSSGSYDIYISDSHAESVAVTSGSGDVDKCSLTFTPYFSHSRYTVESASSGLQESINLRCGMSPHHNENARCNLYLVPAYATNRTTIYNVYGTIFFHSSNSIIGAYGIVLNCQGRGACLQLGDLSNSTDYSNDIIAGLTFMSSDYSANHSYGGVDVVKTERSHGVVTVTTETPHQFRPGDMVTILFTDNNAYWGDAVVKAVPNSTTFTYTHSGVDIPSQVTPGVVALAYTAILDNSQNAHLVDITNAGGWFNNFFDMWDDENVTIDHFANASADVNHAAHWSGSFIFSAGNQGPKKPMAPVISLLNSTITSSANAVTVYNSNGIYIENTVLQGTSLWQVHLSNETGNYQGAYLKNIYSESSIASNPASPIRSPFPGLGIAGLIAGGGAQVEIAGIGGVEGAFQDGGNGTIPYSYFVVANDLTTETQTSPMQILNWRSTGHDSIPVKWPRVANGADRITYDIIRTKTPVGVGAVYPYNGGCSGGNGDACGYVAVGLSQSSACSDSLVCSFVDHGSASTRPYSIKQGNYGGNLAFWPGSIVSVRNSIVVEHEQSNVVAVGLSGNPVQVSAMCEDYGQASPGGFTTCLASRTTPNNSVPNQTATLVTDGPAQGGGTSLSKGRLNFSTAPGAILQPHHIITLIDSQPTLTRATTGYRPPASSDDAWIGTDVAKGGVALNSSQLAFGAPVSISNYIHSPGDGVHSDWLERLTAQQKTFAVPVKISGGNTLTVGDGSPLSRMKIYSVVVPLSRVPAHSCIDLPREAKGLVNSDQIGSVSPPGKLGNLSLNAYPMANDKLVFHFCNPGDAEATSPSGTYSFLAVH
jgi:hypothetical protein